MPSFDVVSEIDSHELTNAVDQANREVSQRFDFKDTGANFELGKESRHQRCARQAEFQLKQMLDILKLKLAKRGIDVAASNRSEPVTISARGPAGRRAAARHRCRTPARSCRSLVKDSKLKVQASIQGEQLRVTGKQRDDLQAAMALIRKAGLDRPLQFKNFRD